MGYSTLLKRTLNYFYAKPDAAGCASDLAETCPPPSTLHTSASRTTPSSKIVIVGSGCFGISTALHLLRRGYTDVTILDRSPVLPAPDAASTDINKIVRSAYHDVFYCELAREAIEAWKNREEWDDHYHESGVLVLGPSSSIYADRAYKNDVAHGARVKTISTSTLASSEDKDNAGAADDQSHNTTELSEIFPPDITLGPSVTGAHGYVNNDSGWVYAEGGVRRAIDLVKGLGGRVLAGKEIVTLIKSEEEEGASSAIRRRTIRTVGVRCKDGSEYLADVVLLATGSWTSSAFPELDLGERCFASGQSIVTIQLTPEEAERYRRCPVVLDFGPSGFYSFPPDKNDVLKIAKHTGGVANFVPIPTALGVDAAKHRISTPRTLYSHGEDGLKVPRSEAQFVRECLANVYPELAKKPFKGTRLCWYTDSPDCDWIIDYHPSDAGLALATAGSGHAFKFLPVIGRLVADRLEGKMDNELRKKFAVDRPLKNKESILERDVSRVRVLHEDELSGPDGL